MSGKFVLFQEDMDMEHCLLHSLCYRAGSDGVDWKVIMAALTKIRHKIKDQNMGGATHCYSPIESGEKNGLSQARFAN